MTFGARCQQHFHEQLGSGGCNAALGVGALEGATLPVARMGMLEMLPTTFWLPSLEQQLSLGAFGLWTVALCSACGFHFEP